MEPVRSEARGKPSESLSFALDGDSRTLAPFSLSLVPGKEVNGLALLYTPAMMWSPRPEAKGSISQGLKSPNCEAK